MTAQITAQITALNDMKLDVVKKEKQLTPYKQTPFHRLESGYCNQDWLIYEERWKLHILKEDIISTFATKHRFHLKTKLSKA